MRSGILQGAVEWHYRNGGVLYPNNTTTIPTITSATPGNCRTISRSRHTSNARPMASTASIWPTALTYATNVNEYDQNQHKLPPNPVAPINAIRRQCTGTRRNSCGRLANSETVRITTSIQTV